MNESNIKLIPKKIKYLVTILFLLFFLAIVGSIVTFIILGYNNYFEPGLAIDGEVIRRGLGIYVFIPVFLFLVWCYFGMLKRYIWLHNSLLSDGVKKSKRYKYFHSMTNIYSPTRFLAWYFVKRYNFVSEAIKHQNLFREEEIFWLTNHHK